VAKMEKLSLEQSWNNWVDCIKGNDINSVFQQISLMIWDTAIFRLVIEGRQIQIEKNFDNPAINGSLHSFIDRNYLQSQVTFIRRLTDKYYGLTGKKAVYSIYALINDIYSYRNELTREVFFKLRNLPYDYTEIRKREREYSSKQPLGTGSFVPSEFDWESIAETHQTFDRLSGTSQNDRRSNDVIAERVFVRLREKLDACQEITNYVDKFVAHSATPESRAIQNVSTSEITFRHLWEAHHIIFEVAEFLSVILFSEGHMALAIENPNFFQYWETPLFETREISRLQDTFENYRKETEKWNLSGIEDTWQWIEPEKL
jgi:hypothetical protein